MNLFLFTEIFVEHRPRTAPLRITGHTIDESVGFGEQNDRHSLGPTAFLPMRRKRCVKVFPQQHKDRADHDASDGTAPRWKPVEPTVHQRPGTSPMDASHGSDDNQGNDYISGVQTAFYAAR